MCHMHQHIVQADSVNSCIPEMHHMHQHITHVDSQFKYSCVHCIIKIKYYCHFYLSDSLPQEGSPQTVGIVRLLPKQQQFFFYYALGGNCSNGNMDFVAISINMDLMCITTSLHKCPKAENKVMLMLQIHCNRLVKCHISTKVAQMKYFYTGITTILVSNLP